VSELFLQLRRNDWTTLRAFRGHNDAGRGCKLKTYVILITTRMLARMAARKKTAANGLISIDGPEPIEVADISTTDRLAADLVLAVTELADPRDRAVLFLYKIEGRDVNEVAQILNITESNVYTRCSRALEGLREVLRKEGVHV
jgi:RNA polymerase sigma factor (sigma-70 family)